jgi:hypothetical protein
VPKSEFLTELIVNLYKTVKPDVFLLVYPTLETRPILACFGLLWLALACFGLLL